MKKIICLICLICLNHAISVYADEPSIGRVNTLKGSVSIMRQHEVIVANIGSKIFQDDILQTGADGAVGIILRDNTIFSLGPESKLTMEEFQFAPAEGKFSLVTKMLKGTFSYMSGLIGKQAPESVQVETPVGTIGIRGTRFVASIAHD